MTVSRGPCCRPVGIAVLYAIAVALPSALCACALLAVVLAWGAPPAAAVVARPAGPGATAAALTPGEASTASLLTLKQGRRRGRALGLGLGIVGVALLVGGLVAGSAGAIVGRRELTDDWIYEGFEVVAAGVLLVGLGAYWVYDRRRLG